MLSGSIDPHYAIAGFLVGALVGVTGVGGGSLMTPILIVLFGVSPATAVGTDLLFAAATKTVGSFVHGFNRTIDWRVVRRLATGSIPATGLALVVLSWLNMRTGSAHQVVMAVLSIALWCRRDRRYGFGALVSPGVDSTDRWLRYRARCPFDTDCGPWLWGDGLGRSSHAGIAAGGIAPRHFCWQLNISAGSRHGPTISSGSSSNRGGEQTYCRCYYPAEGERGDSPYDSSFKFRVPSCFGRRGRYRRNRNGWNVLRLKVTAKLLVLAERRLNESRRTKLYSAHCAAPVLGK
jgi:hypothetical protein